MQVEQYYSDDYAGLKSGNIHFYYGYEVTNEKDEDDWCFQVKIDGKETYRIPTSEIVKSIDDRQLDSPQDFLSAGIGIWLLLK